MQGLIAGGDPRLLTSTQDNEDAAVVTVPGGKALVQTVDFFTPVVNDPYRFGQIAAANALSDVYAMGAEPWTAMNIVCFPIKSEPKAVLRAILEGGLDKVFESGAAMAGGHSVQDDEIKYGLAVTGLVDPDRFATNGGVQPGDVLLLTKPVGTGVLATAIKAGWEGAKEMEDELYRWAARLNAGAGAVVRALELKGVTDVTGFGLGGHALEMARASGVVIDLWAQTAPVIPKAMELASMGLMPEGSYANKGFCQSWVQTDEQLDLVRLDMLFDAQTSGGLLMAVPEAKLAEAARMLEDGGDMAVAVGQAAAVGEGEHGRLRIVNR